MVGPKLKFQKVGHDVEDILTTEKATCVGGNDKVLAIGTSKGRVYILDFQGTQVRICGWSNAGVQTTKTHIFGLLFAARAYSFRRVAVTRPTVLP